MRKRARLMLVVLSLAGTTSCAVLEEHWQKAPYLYTCTEEDSKRIRAEVEYCVKESGYTRPFCYGSAIARVCARK